MELPTDDALHYAFPAPPLEGRPAGRLSMRWQRPLLLAAMKAGLANQVH
jgi:hypothetical protein